MSRLTPVFLVLGLLPSCMQVRTEVEIDAPPHAVWQTLTDFASYPEWNPYHVEVEGDRADEAPLRVAVSKPDGTELEIDPYVQRLSWNRELTWGGGIPLVFTGSHAFRLEPLDGGRRTLLRQDEDFVGFAVPFAELGSIEAGYREMNEALKQHVEREISAARGR